MNFVEIIENRKNTCWKQTKNHGKTSSLSPGTTLQVRQPDGGAQVQLL